MKNLKKGIVALVMLLCVAMVSPVTTSQIFNVETVQAAAKMNKTKATLIKGQSLQLKVNGNSKKVKWSSSRKGVATVTSKGKVTAKNAGTAVITAKVGKKKYTCKITVEAPRLSKTSISLTVGNKYNLKVTGTKQKITWSSSNKSVAIVLNNGLVITKKVGTAQIYAKVGTKKYVCKVTVKKRQVGGNTVKPTSKPTATPTPRPELSSSVNSISIKENESDSVSIKFTGTGYVYYDIADSSIVECQWSKKWNNSSTLLNITGKKAGTTTVTVTNSVTSDYVKITVNVISAVSIKLPDIPKTIYEYSGNYISKACEVTNVYYTVDKTAGSYYYKIYLDGMKTYDKRGSNISSSCHVGYKLYKNGAVIKSGTIYSPAISVGESFSGCWANGYLDSPGEYELVLLNMG